MAMKPGATTLLEYHFGGSHGPLVHNLSHLPSNSRRGDFETRAVLCGTVCAWIRRTTPRRVSRPSSSRSPTTRGRQNWARRRTPRAVAATRAPTARAPIYPRRCHRCRRRRQGRTTALNTHRRALFSLCPRFPLGPRPAAAEDIGGHSVGGARDRCRGLHGRCCGRRGLHLDHRQRAASRSSISQASVCRASPGASPTIQPNVPGGGPAEHADPRAGGRTTQRVRHQREQDAHMQQQPGEH